MPAINEAMKSANELRRRSGPDSSAWAKIDEALVEDAAAIPFDWDNGDSIEGRDVNGVADVCGRRGRGTTPGRR